MEQMYMETLEKNFHAMKKRIFFHTTLQHKNKFDVSISEKKTFSVMNVINLHANGKGRIK
jgi:hypothetical protein